MVIRKKFSVFRFWDDCIKYNCIVSEKGRVGVVFLFVDFFINFIRGRLFDSWR